MLFISGPSEGGAYSFQDLLRGGGRGLFISGPFEGGGRLFISGPFEGKSYWREGLISFFHSKGGLIREGAYLSGGLNREITVNANDLVALKIVSIRYNN